MLHLIGDVVVLAAVAVVAWFAGAHNAKTAAAELAKAEAALSIAEAAHTFATGKGGAA